MTIAKHLHESATHKDGRDDSCPVCARWLAEARLEAEIEAEERAARLAERRKRFDAEYPGVADALAAMPDNDFTLSLRRDLNCYGYLTPKQVARVRK